MCLMAWLVVMYGWVGFGDELLHESHGGGIFWYLAVA